MGRVIPHRVLIIDDEESIRSLIVEIIQSELNTVECMEAQNAQEAFQQMKEKLPGLIITDVMMQDMNGLQILSMLRNSNNHAIRNIPVIVLSGVGNNEIVVKAKQLGAADYITKPFDQRIFTMKIKKYLKIK